MISTLTETLNARCHVYSGHCRQCRFPGYIGKKGFISLPKHPCMNVNFRGGCPIPVWIGSLSVPSFPQYRTGIMLAAQSDGMTLYLVLDLQHALHIALQLGAKMLCQCNLLGQSCSNMRGGAIACSVLAEYPV